MNKLDLIQQKCIEANPEIKTRTCPNESCLDTRIRLADVLLAFPDEPSAFWLHDSEAAFDFDSPKRMQGKRIYWNLHEDDLSKQSEDTISFLYDLLK